MWERLQRRDNAGLAPSPDTKVPPTLVRDVSTSLDMTEARNAANIALDYSHTPSLRSSSVTSAAQFEFAAGLAGLG
jgi:hypothetical protein